MMSSGCPFRIRAVTAILAAAVFWSPLIPTWAATSGPSRLRDAKQVGAAQLALTQVRATAANGGVLIEWRTGLEFDNLGFNVYRERSGRHEQLNPGIIAGSALIAGRGNPLQAGFSYSWFDPAGTLDCQYYLEDVDVSGKALLHDPVSPVWSNVLPMRSQSELLGNLGAASRAATIQSELPETAESLLRQNSAEAAPAGTLTDQWAIANQPALKIGVRATGWYHITQAEMAAAAFDVTGDARNLRMFVNATEIAIRVSRETGALTSADYVEFWGQGLDIASTDTQIYWLLNGAQAGKRIGWVGELQLDAAPTPQPAAAKPTPETALAWFGSVTGALSGSNIGGRSAEVELGSTRAERESATSVGASSSGASIGDSSIGSLTETEYKTVRGIERADTPAKSRTNGKFGTTRNPKLIEERADNPTVRAPSAHRGIAVNRKRSRRRRHRRYHSSSLRWNHATMSVLPAPAFIDTVERKDRTIYYALALNGDAENFYGDIIAGDPAPLTLTLHNADTASAGTAELTVSLQGVTLQFHQVNAFLNGAFIGTITFFDQKSAVQTFPVSVSLLLEGDNAVKLLPVAAGHDTSLVDYVRLTFPHILKADNNSLQFSIRSTQTARVDGFTIPNIRVLDLSDLTSVQEIRPIVETSGTGYAVTIPAGRRGKKGRRLIALPDTQLSEAASLTLNQPSTLNLNTNAADLLIISYKDFIPALAPLISQRQAQGFAVAVVNVEEVFDEFSYGAHSAQAIKDFLSLAYTTWTKKPRYLLLVGDASYDPRNYLGNGDWDLVPSKHVDTALMEADSDDSLADFDGDGVPELAVGRLPVRTPAEANLVVSKIVNFTPPTNPQSAMMVADNPVGYDFEAFDEQLIQGLPASMNVQRVYRQQAGSDAAQRNDIISKFNAGPALVTYSGHGNVDVWAGFVFTSTDAMALTNGSRLPFVVVMDCLNGFFSDPVLPCIGESLLTAPNGGAVASFASSGLTVAGPQHQMGQRMFQLLYSGPSISIGDASRQSKTATDDLDVRRTWILFGDPTMKIR
jgi:hypothetical protein